MNAALNTKAIKAKVLKVGENELLSTEERDVLRALFREYLTKGGVNRITQIGIKAMCPSLGSHPRHEGYENPKSTFRKIQQIIRTLRIEHHVPILSGREGYWIPKSDAEVLEYLERIEGQAKAQSAAWFETYKAMKDTFGVNSAYFENQSPLKV